MGGNGATIDLLDDLISRARQAGADAADAMLVESGGLTATWRLGKLETVERAESRDLGLRVFIGPRQAIVATEDLSPASLMRLVERAVTMANALPGDPHAGLADPEQIARDLPALDLDDGEEPDGGRLAARAAEAEDAARAHPGITNSEGAYAGWSRRRTTLVASNGFAGSSTRSAHGLGVSVIAGRGGNGGMERDDDQASRVYCTDLPPPAEIGRRAAERTVRRLGARKVPTQRVPVIYDPRLSAGIVRHLVSAISGPAVARGTTFLKDRMGDEIFAPGITITEDPLRARGLRSRRHDGEGLPVTARTLIERGRLTTWLLDCASARRLGLESTGHASRSPSAPPSPAPSNIWLEPGDLEPAALYADLDAGFYVTEMLGMGINLVTGDYSRGAAGFWIENGEITFPVSEVTVAGSLPAMFKNLTPANDLEHRFGIDAPTLRIDGMTVAGQ